MFNHRDQEFMKFVRQRNLQNQRQKKRINLGAIIQIFNKFKRIKFKYFLSFLTVLIVIIYQAYSPVDYRSSSDWITYLSNIPKPPTSQSPWPWKDHQTIHPIITSITPEIETSIKSVAQYIAEHETNPYLQVKAIHDYVISRVTYDLDVLTTGIRPSQDAQTVFLTHKGVCEGYANLFRELGQAMGLDVVYIKGKVRRDLAPIDLIPEAFRLLKSNYDWTLHAWNAVNVDGNWQLVDTTWDDTDSESLYRTDYLLIPPEVMIISHLPVIQSWQLLHHPKNYTSFEKQPILNPQFFAEGLTMISPREYDTTVQKTGVIEIQTSPNYTGIIYGLLSKNRESKSFLWNGFFNRSKAQDEEVKVCKTDKNVRGNVRINCQFSQAGNYEVLLFSFDPKNESVNTQRDFRGRLKFSSREVKD
ncbi:transglutaminase domain-containing protein [Capilliphycus salinus ALCB114379]|uniref:transglutaminase domain-containing protein n=1 Tax=Capilliphycus salinus TaxID=2768948 RepID=UPI0039A4E1AA